MDDDEAVGTGSSPLERLRGPARAQMRREMGQYLHPEFVKRYVQYVRRHRYASADQHMTITASAAKAIHGFWLELRQGNQNW